MQEAELGAAVIHTSPDWHLEVLVSGLTSEETIVMSVRRAQEHWNFSITYGKTRTR